MRFEVRGVDAAAGAGVIHGIVKVQHFVEHHVFESQARNAWIVEYAADDDGVVGWIEVPEARARANPAPAERGPRHHAAEMGHIQFFEDFLEVVKSSGRT